MVENEISSFHTTPVLLLHAALNMAVFLLIGKTSALTMNISGVVKDWLLIGLSVWIYRYVSEGRPPPWLAPASLAAFLAGREGPAGSGPLQLVNK